MPELPEVETIRRGLVPRLVGRRLGAAWAFPHEKFTPALGASGHRVLDLTRRGKYLLVGLDGPGSPELVVHLGMTGSLQVVPVVSVEADSYVRARWALDPAEGGGEALVYRDIRRFGRLALARDGIYRGTLAVQGPDALDPRLTALEFWQALTASRRAVKTRLLSQRPLAGVGNIYADEALWLAGIDPRARRVGRERATVLLDALRHVLSAGLDNGGTTLRDYRDAEGGHGRNQERLSCYGRSGRPCLHCGTTLAKLDLDGRATTYCPSCQVR